mgnify:FL=1
MFLMFVSFIVFVGTLAVHILIHRHLSYRWGIVTAKTIIVYVIGFLVLAGIVRSMQFPVTALWFYTLLVLSYLLYFLSFLSDGESPSAKILGMVASHGPLSRREILTRLTNEELLGTRITRLLRSGFLRRVGDRLHVRPGGAVIAEFFELYRKLLGWDRGG